MMRTLRALTLLFAFPWALGCGGGAESGPNPTDRGSDVAPRELVENPQYRGWAAFPKGTSVVHRSVTRTDVREGETVTTTTYTLIDRADDRAVVEMRAFTKRYDGAEIDNPPERFTVPRRIPLATGVSKSEFGKSAEGLPEGEETITVGGKEYRTKWRTGKDRTEAGEVLVKVWSSDAVPGGLVRSVTRVPAVGKTTTIELVEVKTP